MNGSGQIQVELAQEQFGFLRDSAERCDSPDVLAVPSRQQKWSSIRNVEWKMSKYERLARLMKIMNLVRSHKKPNRKFLAEQLEVCTRTIQRDINSLCYAGVPIFWSNDRYEIMPDFFMPPTSLSLEEAFHLVSAARTGSMGKGISEQRAIESAISKIIVRLPDETRKNLEAALDEADSCLPSQSPKSLYNGSVAIR